MMRMGSPMNASDFGSVNDWSFGRTVSPYNFSGSMLRRASSPFNGLMSSQLSYAPTVWSPSNGPPMSYGSPDFSSALSEMNCSGLSAASSLASNRIVLPQPRGRQADGAKVQQKNGQMQL